MERLTHKRSNGIKEGYWSSNRKEELVKRLAEYENTGLIPEEIESLNDFEKSQVGEMLKRLSEEQRKHRWIPVEERSPEDDSFVLVTADGIYNAITFSRAILLASYCEDDGWFIEGYPDWDDPDVIAWQPLPEPYKGGQNET